uniref:CTCHY-type domain-containing protein n=2 Tax=Photinus pyralis TaxID=7054 RepID=A0A1Y1N7L4_PHOPY
MSHVEVILEDLTSHPKCPHGPTVLFSRVSDGRRINFFACSACRDRKQCSFYLGTEEKMTSIAQQKWKEATENFTKCINHRKQFMGLNEIKLMSPSLRRYCHTCEQFVPSKYVDKHLAHLSTASISDYLLMHPSELLHPLDNPKKEAQFLFSHTAVKTLVEIIRQQSFSYVLSIGAPRIHEHISSSCEDMTSLLLDIDKRYHSFFGPLQFCWYNMFNNHFFSKDAKDIFHDFLKQSAGQLVIVMDPPFGGRIELLAQTVVSINRLNKAVNGSENDLPVLFVFPYFMEPQILNSFSDFVMLDYKVDYDNHPLFRDGPKGRKQGSPVRIFTNISVSSITLPADEGYKFCDKCVRWVSLENRHCNECELCTSKDGRTYVHCQKCQRCVKPTWSHCATCNRCAQTDHDCSEIVFSQVGKKVEVALIFSYFLGMFPLQRART